MMINLAVVMCTYNRKALTERCICQINEAVKRQSNIQCKIYVCDDRSTDGTAAMLQEKFQNVVLLNGTGKLFWCKSMHLAMQEASKQGYDFYLMVNDDTDFKDNVLVTMFDSFQKAGKSCGIVGSMCYNNICTYGGRTFDKQLIQPNGELQRCYWSNWNCFLIDCEVIKKVGIIDGKYQHACGDYDYSYRMIKAGFPIFVATDYVGEVPRNSYEGTYRDKTLTRKKRLRLLFSPKGAPIYSYFRYHIRVFGFRNLPKYVYGYLSMIGYIFLGKGLN